MLPLAKRTHRCAVWPERHNRYSIAYTGVPSRTVRYGFQGQIAYARYRIN